ncbi:MAG: FHA domain-containing protein [Acidobacteria bacterium]|nr:FHA domain-containing protein [Acidobacteriota bacterium]
MKNPVQIKIECMKCHTPFLASFRAHSDIATAPQNHELATVVNGQSKLPPGKRVSLVVIDGPVKGQSFRLSKPAVTIGRVGTDIVVNDPEVSGSHCALEVHGSYGVLVDTGSTNGTFIDEQPIQRQRLEHLGEFRVGKTRMLFVVAEEDSTVPGAE